MGARETKELERRIAFSLARCFHDIQRLDWSSPLESNSIAKLELNVTKENCIVAFVDYQGSALLRLDGRAFWSLDGYHKSACIPLGKHELCAEFTPYKAFGELIEIFPGKPTLAIRDPVVYKCWNYFSSIFQLAKLTSIPELSKDLFELLTSALGVAYFESVTRDQLSLAAYLSPDPFPNELLEVIPKNGKHIEEIGYKEEKNYSKWSSALALIEAGLKNLTEKYGKGGEVLGISHGHIDTAWLWHFDETLKKVPRTFSVVSTLQRDFSFHHMQSTALYFEWIKEKEPLLYEEVKNYVNRGLWELGAGWVESDANLISGESFARQFLYSQRFYLTEFGKLARVYWLPDSFGFAASVPQIAKLGGAEIFATQKVFWNDTNTFPYSLFYWVGIDGTVLNSIAFGHSRDGYNSDFALDRFLEQWRNWQDKKDPMLYAFGYGDGGGGPTEEMLIRAEILNKLPSLPKIKLEYPSLKERYMDSFASLKDQTWSGELYAEFHRGVMTSHTRIKRLNRRAELSLREAELWTGILEFSSDGRNRSALRKEFEELWKIVLKNQFHDVLPGSAINEAYVTAYQELEKVVERAGQLSQESMTALAPNGVGLLFNSLPWARKCEYITLPTGDYTSSQKTEEGYLVRVSVPSVGYSRLGKESILVVEAPASVMEYDKKIIFENKHFKITLEKSEGCISSIYDKEFDREVIREKSNRLVFYENIPGWADAWDIEKGYKNTAFELFTVEELKVIESGPLRVRVRARHKFRNSTINQDIILCADSRRVDFVTTTDLRDRELLLKVWFHFIINSDTATFDIPFGNLERKTARNTSWEKARFEVPMLKWADISEGDYGIALLNDGRHGISAEDGSLGLSIAKTPIYPDYASDSDGPSTFTYSLYPHKDDWRKARVPQVAYELSVPIRVVPPNNAKNGSFDSALRSFITVTPDNLMLEAVKLSEDNDESLVLRLYEMHNKRGKARIDMFRKIKSAKLLDLLELSEIAGKELVVEGNSITFPYRNYEILTIKVDF